MQIIVPYLFCFVISSVAGWFVESAYRTVTEKKLINSGFLQGPFIPVYGFGSLIIYLFYSLHLFDNPVVEITIISVLLTALEYVTSLVMEKVLHVKWWDYSNYPLNIDGRVCLLFSFYWVLLTLFSWFLFFPLINRVAALVPSLYLGIGSAAVVAVMVIDLFYSLAKAKAFDAIIKRLPELLEVRIGLPRIDLRRFNDEMRHMRERITGLRFMYHIPSRWFSVRMKESIDRIVQRMKEHEDGRGQ
ncbi:MAG: putative ABC transporter permease [Spirochaetes bacterium]|nr:putative ABC transporter permease [Spirochaetota bacterium]